MPRKLVASTCVMISLGLCLTLACADEKTERGRYLVEFSGCFDYHTPGYFFGKPDMTRFLGGSVVGFEIPETGVFYGPNLTPDPETGLGNWSEAEIVIAMQTSKHPDGLELALIMPWKSFAKMTKEDAEAIAAYLKTLPIVQNKGPGAFGPGEKPTSFVMKIVAP